MSALDLDTEIGKLSVSALGRDGSTLTLDIRTVDTFPDNLEAPMCPILFPHPTQWKGEMSSIPRIWDTPEYPLVEKAIALNYMFLYAEVGEDRGIHVFYKPCTLMLDALMLKLIRLDVSMTGKITVTSTPIGKITETVTNKNYFGGTITIRAILESVE